MSNVASGNYEIKSVRKLDIFEKSIVKFIQRFFDIKN